MDTVVSAFAEGATAEEIALQYPMLDLGDVYSVIGFYLAKKDEVDAYLVDRETQSDQVRNETETRFSPQGIRERLLVRKRSRAIASAADVGIMPATGGLPVPVRMTHLEAR